MATPKRLNFSSPCVGDDSDHTPSSSPFVSQGKSPRKRSASEALAKEESKKKKKKKTKNKKMDSSLFKRIWNEEDELLVLKGLVDYRIKSRHEPKIDWDGFYRFLGGSIVAKFSKEQVLSKIRKLKRRFIVHLERINERKDPNFTTSSDSEAFGFSMMLWGPIEAEVSDADVDKEHEHEEMLQEHGEQPLNDNGAAKIMGNGDASGEAHQSESGEEMLKDHEEVADAEHLDDNAAAKLHDEVVVDEIIENGTARKAQQSENGEELLKEHDEDAVNAEPLHDNGAAKIMGNKTARKVQKSKNDKEMLKEHGEVTNAEPLHDNGAVKITENKTTRKAQKSKNGKEMFKEHEEVTNVEPLNDNGAAKIAENGTTAGQESHNEDDELCAVRDAFETMMSQGLSDYQKKLQLKKLMNLGTVNRRQLSDEWKALCDEERRLNIKKLRFSTKLAEATYDR